MRLIIIDKLVHHSWVMAIPRLINMGVEHYLVAAAVRAILAQRLIKKICQNCKTEVPLDAKSKVIINQLGYSEDDIPHVYKGTGCNRCRNTGFTGRMGVHELLVVNEDLLSSLGDDLNVRVIKNLALERGFKTMMDDGIDKVKQGLITLEGVLESIAKNDD